MKNKLILVLAVAMIGISATVSTNLFEISKNIDIYTAIYRELNSYYVDEIDPNDLMRDGVDAMLKSLDPYTNYISEAELENHRFQMTGKYGGIGAVIRKQGDQPVIVEPYEGFGAYKSGIKAGDVLKEIDGKSTEGKSTEDISNILRGSPGTTVKIKLERPHSDKGIFEIEVKREEVKVENVPYYGMVNDKVGYIKLTQFTENSGKNVANALKEMKAENELAGVILDLRGNLGGLLREAVAVSNVFVPKGELIVSTKGKVKDWDRDFKTLAEPVDANIRVAVLTDRSSASASEIVAGVIQDLDRGVVIGQRSFGKGLVQSTRDVPYKTKLKITTAKYYTPSGRCIQAINYADKNDDGSVAKIPDSLQTAFKTRSGRTVYDGGGILPDIEIEDDLYKDISIALMRNNHIFDFATEYASKRSEIGEAKDYRFSDTDYADFVKFLEGKEYEYSTESESVIERLKEVAEEEEYLASIKQELDEMTDKLAVDKDRDLEKFQDEISDLLRMEIVKRYHYQQGAIEASFINDPEMEAALEVLADIDDYAKVLRP